MMVTTRCRLTDHDALKLCRGRWLDEHDPIVSDADEAAWERRFALLLALLAPPGERARRAG